MADSTNSQYSGQTNLPNGGQVTTVSGLGPGDPEYYQQKQQVSPDTVPSIPLASPDIVPSIPLVPINAMVTNPKSLGVNDISDIRPTSSLVTLPIRGEKRLIPTTVNASQIQQQFDAQNPKGTTIASAAKAFAKQQNQVEDTDFYITGDSEAKNYQNYVDYIEIRIPHRGISPSSLLSDPSQWATFRFLINPHTITVNRQTVDSQSLTRGGWQFGVWGEDTFMVQMQGTSAGAYFSLGLTDEFSYYAVSYRNLMQLQEVFENNGYWFEGEEFNEGPLAADYLRRRIRMHQDVELTVGNFLWSGMFDSFTISQDATQPFMLNFSLSFFVWKERYRTSSPYWKSIHNDVQRGHSYDAVVGHTNAIQTNNALSQQTTPSVAAQVKAVQLETTLNSNGSGPQAPAVISANNTTADVNQTLIQGYLNGDISASTLQDNHVEGPDPLAPYASWFGLDK